jgi:tRNA dimethylallyltransferase
VDRLGTDKRGSQRVVWQPSPCELLIPAACQARPPVIVISGPTGVGKTRLALLLASLMPAEVVSADSMQVYRGMDIGTAKATPAERAAVRHHLIDLCEVTDRFSVFDFFHAAQRAIQDIHARGKIPIVCGGTGFYIHALLYGPPSGPAPDPDLRRSLEAEIELQGADVLFERLRSADPDYAATITVNDRQKIVRAIEIMHLTGQRVSELSWQGREELDQYKFLCCFLHMPRETLYPLLDHRCDRMIAEGLIEEVSRLDSRGLRQNHSASQAIGYRHCLEFLDSAGTPGDFEEFVQRFRRDTHRYAKRQFTWFRKEPLFRWINVADADFELLADQMVQEVQRSI